MEQLLELALIGDVEDALLNELAAPKREQFLRSTKYERLNLDNLTDDECIAYFRFPRLYIEDALREWP